MAMKSENLHEGLMSKSVDFPKPVAFATCSYMKKRSGARTRMVFEALSSWSDLLDLPFAEKIFLDDRSPDCHALRLLQSTHMLEKFTRAEYCVTEHPPACAFGYVGALQLAASPYIMHLDDDVYFTGSQDEGRKLISEAIRVMEEDPAIMGINLRSLDPSFQGHDWLPGEPYREEPPFYHPRKYFGNAASIIRRELLERIPYSQLISWGEHQPGTWEMMVSRSPREFLTGELKTLFHVKRESYFLNSTNDILIAARIKYVARTWLQKLKARH
jgi:hypothetical protein